LLAVELVGAMTRLILTSPHGMGLRNTHFADITIPFTFRFVGGLLPSPDELATYLAARSDDHRPGCHWSDYVGRWSFATETRKDLGLVEFCQHCETVELWFDPNPNDQMHLVWLLDYFRSYPEILDRLKLRFVDYELISASDEELGRWKVAVADVTKAELEAATVTWQAYRATTPQTCFELLSRDLSALPLLRPVLSDLLEELPSGATGLGATEMRILELISAGYWHPYDLRPLYKGRYQRRVFNEEEFGTLLEGLAHGPRPAIAGLDDELRTLKRDNYRSRADAWLRSRLSLTEFGKAIVAHKEDFSKHNPIDRWWGGTHLTNDRLWRWNPTLMKP
jgi:hypothetical protein